MRTGGTSLGSLTLGLALLTGGVAVGPPASAEEPVTISASGPVKVTTSTGTSTRRVVATFVITDPTNTVTGATICRAWGGKPKQGCQYKRLGAPVLLDEYGDPVDEYGDPVVDSEYTRWDVVGGPGSWTVSYPIGYEEISREECLEAGWGDKPFSVSMDAQNDAGVVLASSTWKYDVVCTGIEGGAVGPDRTMVSRSHTVESKPFNFYVLDTRHVLRAFRVCAYNWYTGKYFDCDYEDLTKQYRTDDGWFVSYSLTWKPLNSTTCRYVGRKWPSAGFRIQFYRAGLDHQLTLHRYTRLDC